MGGERLLEEIAELARIPAPTFAEEARLAWLERRLDGAPGRVRRDGVGNVVWSWGDGRPELLLTAHVDTAFAAETPLMVERHGDFLEGPGVGDNAAAVMVAVDVVEALLARESLAPGAVAFTVGEEGLGNLRGADFALRELRPRACIALEGHGLDHVLVDAVGSIRARVRIHGPGGHSWVDRGTPSAIHALLAVGADLASSGNPESPVNIGVVSGGRAVNAVADTAELVVEMRSLHEEDLDGFAELLAGLDAEPPLELRSDVLGRRPAGRLDPGDDLAHAVRSVRSELGLADNLGAGSTDANAAFPLGIPALALGVSRGSGMHTAHERIEVASLAAGRRQLEHVLVRLLGSRTS
jgi:acetylornithine deacetylase/succinyl-diaminopimelate desuccinylase-like protein